MRIAVTSRGDTIESPVDSRLGRAKGFIFTDENGGSCEYIDNIQNLNAASGAGVQSAQNIINNNAEAVITGNCGPKAFRVLAAGNVKVYTGASGTVEQALAEFRDGTLKESSEANVDGHW